MCTPKRRVRKQFRIYWPCFLCAWGVGILLAREIYGYGIAGLEQNCELVVILLQQDQGAVDTGNQMTKEDLCVHENNNVPY